MLVALCTLGAAGQDALTSCVSPGFGAGGAIFVATITGTQLDPAKGQPRVTLAINEYFRGPKVTRDRVDVPIDWTLGPKVLPVMRTPVWHNVTPEIGKQVLLMTWKGERELRARCVLDWSGTDASSQARIAGVIKHMVALTELPVAQKIQAMEAALSDPEVAVRNFAEKYLTSAKVRDPEVRSLLFEHYASIVLDVNNPRRIEALSAIKRAYDGFSPDSEVNYRILSFIADRMADSDLQVRSIAVQFLHSKLLSQTKYKPDISRIRMTDPKAIEQQLEEDSKQGFEFSKQAQSLLGLLKGSH
jgi:hypothetical protein